MLMNNIGNHQFSIPQEEIDKNKLFNPFSNKPDPIDVNQCYISRCCG